MKKIAPFTVSRAGALDPKSPNIEPRAREFCTSAQARRGSTLVVQRQAGRLTSWVLMDDVASADKPALRLAQAVSGRLAPQPGAPDLSAPVVGRLEYTKTDASAHVTGAGKDITETARALASALPDGGWVAVTLRAATKRRRRWLPGLDETGWWATWLAYRMGTSRPVHHSVDPGAMVATFYAGGQTQAEVSDALNAVTSNLPGFDLDAKVVFPSSARPAFLSLLAGVVLWAAVLLGLPRAPQTLFDSLPALAHVPTWVGWAAFAVGLVAFLGLRRGWIPTESSRLFSGLAHGVLPVPPARRTPPAKPRKERTVRNKDGDDVHYEASEGAYPLHDACFKIGPMLVASFIAPHAGSASGAATAEARPVPPEMTVRIGPLLGHDQSGSPVFLSAAPSENTVAAVGDSGSGKSNAIRLLTAFDMYERVKPSGARGFPGQDNALIIFETKPEGAEETERWAQALGDVTTRVELSNPGTPGIDPFGWMATVAEKASFALAMMKDYWGEDAIGAQSTRTLNYLLPAAFATDDAAAVRAGLPTGMSPFFYADVLNGGHGDDGFSALASALIEQRDDLRSACTARIENGKRVPTSWQDRLDDLEVACSELSPLISATPSTRQKWWDAPGSKIDAMKRLEAWWTPQRPKFTWQQILDNSLAVVILTGLDSTGRQFEDDGASIVSTMLAYSLQKYMDRFCAGRGDQHRWTTIVADELFVIASTSGRLLTWGRDQGRGYGVRLHLATQRPRQLAANPALFDAFMSLTNLLVLPVEDSKAAAELARVLGGASGTWTEDDITHLPVYHAAVRARSGGQRRDSFTCRIDYFERLLGPERLAAFEAAMTEGARS